MENKKIDENLINMDDIKVLLNQEDDKEYRIMKVDVLVPSKSKYRVEFSYSKKFEELLNPFQEELLNISEEIYKQFRTVLYKELNIPAEAKYNLMDITIDNNSLGNYIVIDVPILRLLPKKIVKKDRLFLNYVVDRLEQISINLTRSLHSFIDKYFNMFTKRPLIEDYEFIMYYNGDNLLYSDFVQTSDFDYTMEKYNIFKLVNEENLLERLEKKILNSSMYIPKKRYLKITFSYIDKVISNINCFPLIASF